MTRTANPTGTSEEETVSHVTSADGTSIGLSVSGDGPPLVLVHGTSADHTRWPAVLPAFEEHFTVYAMDRRGRGLSGDSPVYAIEREYEDVAAVVDAIGGPVDLLGHSYGALCAMEAALLSPNVRRLVLYEPPIPDPAAPLYEDGMRQRLEAMIDRGERSEALTTFFREVVQMSDSEVELLQAAPNWPERLAAAHTVPREFADADYILDPRRFERLWIPVLLITGSESPPIMRSSTEAAHRALPNSRVVVLQGQAHVAVTTAPQLFADRVIEFLTGHA